MTLKQTKLVNGVINSIKNNTNKTIRDISIESGYSINSRKMYSKGTKRHIFEALKKLGYGKEDLEKRFELGTELALAKSDLTNYFRGQEDIARMQGAFIDKQESKVNVNIEHQQSIDEIFKNRLKDVSPSVQ